MTKITTNPFQFRKRSFVLKNVSKTVEKERVEHDFTFVHISSIMFKNGQNCSAELKQQWEASMLVLPFANLFHNQL